MSTRMINGICESEYSESKEYTKQNPKHKFTPRSSTHPQQVKLTNSGYGSFGSGTSVTPVTTVNHKPGINKKCIIATAAISVPAFAIASVVLPTVAGLLSIALLGSVASHTPKGN